MDRTRNDRAADEMTHGSPSASRLFAGPGEMRALCRSFDWTSTPIGPVERWPSSLRTIAATVVAAGFPSIVLWGEELIQIYNDAYVPIIGAKHPRALGRGNAEVWPEVWHINGPIYERVRRGETVDVRDERFPLARGRDGSTEDVYLSLSYSPVLDDAGTVGGVFITMFETTSRVVAERLAAERARLEADVRRAEHVAARLLEQVSDQHITMDADFRILSVNPAAERALGVGRDQLLGKTHWEAFPASVGSEAERQYRRVAAERVEAHFTHHYVGEGYDVHLEIDAYPVDDDLVAVFWRDVTARVRADEALREMNAALEIRNAQLADQAMELELTTSQLQENAAELEATNDELQTTAKALEERSAEAEAAATALRRSEASLRDVFAQAPVSVAVMHGPDHVFTVVSPRYAETPGRGRPLLGRSVREAFPEVVAQGYLDEMDRVYATGVPFFAAERPVRLERDGVAEDRYFNIGYQPLRDDAGRVYGIASVSHDVTEHVLARRELEAARAAAEAGRERLDAVLAQLPLGVIIVEAPSGRVLVVSEAVAGIWRQRRATDAVDRYSDEWTGYHPDGRRLASEEWPIARAAQHGETVSDTIIEIERADGSGRALIEVSAAPVRDASGAVTAAVAVFTDITARVQAERERERLVRELEVERSRLADVFRQAPTFLAVLRGPRFVFEFVNDAYYQLVGHRELLGRPALEAIPEVRGQGFIELLEGVVATGTPFVGRELPILLARTPESPFEERFLDFVYQPLVEADGKRAGVVAHGTDVTEQVLARRDVERLLGESEHARAEAEQARAEADAANRAKSEFLATMSHEIRTPINAIQGYAQLLDLGLGGAVTPQQRDYLSRLATSSHHLLGLINDVLDLSKVEAGELTVTRESAATGTAIAAALDLVGPQAAARGVRLVDAEHGGAGVAYVGDEHRVRQVLVNLLSNAVKFTEPGGRVTVTSGTADHAPPEARVETTDGPWAFVRVEDTGVGIAPELHTAIFDPFVQAESGHRRTKGGTGLGLAISRRLARLMGGDLTVDSAVGRGSTFTLWVPAAERVQTGWTGEMTAERARATRGAGVAAGSLGRLGTILRGEGDAVLASYVERLRADPATPLARAMSRGAVEDHAVTLVADLAQSLVIAGEAGADAINLLRDGSAIQRAIAEHHGVRRYAQGWTLASVRRDYQVLLEEIDRLVRARAGAADDPADRDGSAGALRMVLGLVERAAQASARSWRRASDADGSAAAAGRNGAS
ncbi:MAG TPA: PAS domain-containing protein [Gemmatimonadaceae bacterium]|nr:PAS domain-containing protein [Gemmatimonadaceae bacterium]